jgi:WD40 repeat protein
MGEFFDAIYTRGTDPAVLPRQLANAARELKCCFLVAPEIQGWTAIYASRGQDGNVAKTLHKILETEVLYTLVHDGDLFCYDYHRDGKLVDEYNSRPDYFAKVSARKRQSVAGKPELLLSLLRHPSDADELESILHSEADDDPFHANSQLTQFAELLGLPNYATSYDYLMADEEDEEIERRAEFVHIPGLEPEKAARASARGAMQAETGRLRSEGLLLFEQSPSPLAPVADPAGSGFLTADRDLTFRGIGRPIYRIAPPFGKGPEALGIVAETGHLGVVVSPSGRLLAVAHQQRIEVWNRESGTQVAAMEAGPPIHGVRFLAEDKGLVAVGPLLEIFSLPDGKRVRTVEAGVGHAMALHPTGRLLVVVSRRVTVHVVDLDAGQIVRTFFLDRRQDLGFLEKMQIAVMTAAIGKARRDANRKLRRRPEGSAPFETETETEEPLTAEDPRAFLFSADGQYLVCGTDKSAWAFRWRTLLASGVETPPALYRYQPESKSSGMPMAFLMQTDFSAGVGALEYDAETNSALLGCADGVVRQMNLTSGEVSTLLTVPGGNAIQRLTLSADGSLLSAVDVSMHDLQRRMAAMMGGSSLAAAVRDDEPRDRMTIWDYRKIRKN